MDHFEQTVAAKSIFLVISRKTIIIMTGSKFGLTIWTFQVIHPLYLNLEFPKHVDVDHPKFQHISGIKDMSVPWESGDYRAPPESDQVNCLHLTSILNTLPCSLVVSRDCCRPAALIRTARGMSVAFRQSGHVAISLYCAVSLWGLLHQLFLLPPPISLPQCLLVCLVVIPLLASTPFSLKQV